MPLQGAGALHRRFRALLGLPERIEDRWASATAPRIAHAIPRRTGETARSVRASAGGVVGSGVVNILDAGAKAHDIKPRRGEALRFNARAGGTLFRAKVHKPQQRGQHFKRPAMEEGLEEVGADEILRRWNGAA